MENKDKELVVELLELTGVKNSCIQRKNILKQNMLKNLPEAKDYLEKYLAELNLDDLIEQMIPVYLKYYTPEDIQGFISFYKSPLGQKMINETPPHILHDTAIISTKWAELIGKKLAAQLDNEEWKQKN